jgi:hypothetical protein
MAHCSEPAVTFAKYFTPDADSRCCFATLVFPLFGQVFLTARVSVWDRFYLP